MPAVICPCHRNIRAVGGTTAPAAAAAGAARPARPPVVVSLFGLAGCPLPHTPLALPRGPSRCTGTADRNGATRREETREGRGSSSSTNSSRGGGGPAMLRLLLRWLLCQPRHRRTGAGRRGGGTVCLVDGTEGGNGEKRKRLSCRARGCAACLWFRLLWKTEATTD